MPLEMHRSHGLPPLHARFDPLQFVHAFLTWALRLFLAGPASFAGAGPSDAGTIDARNSAACCWGSETAPLAVLAGAIPSIAVDWGAAIAVRDMLRAGDDVLDDDDDLVFVRAGRCVSVWREFFGWKIREIFFANRGPVFSVGCRDYSAIFIADKLREFFAKFFSPHAKQKPPAPMQHTQQQQQATPDNFVPSFYVIDVLALDGYVDWRATQPQQQQQEAVVSFRDDGSNRSKECIVIVHGRNADGARISMVVHGFRPLVYLPLEDDREATVGELEELIGAAATKHQSWRSPHQQAVDGERTRLRVDGMKHLKGYQDPRDPAPVFAEVALMSESDRQFLDRAIKSHVRSEQRRLEATGGYGGGGDDSGGDDDHGSGEATEAEDLIEKALSDWRVKNLKETFVAAQVRFMAETDVAVGRWTGEFRAAAQSGRSGFRRVDIPAHRTTYCDAEYVVDYEWLKRAIGARSNRQQQQQQQSMDVALPKHFTTASFAIECDAPQTPGAVPVAHPDAAWAKERCIYDAKEQQAAIAQISPHGNSIRRMTVHLTRLTGGSGGGDDDDRQHAHIVLCLLPSVSNAVDYSRTDYGSEAVANGLFRKEGPSVYKFSQEEAMIRMFLHLLSTASDVLVGWKMFHAYSVDQSLHYVFNRMAVRQQQFFQAGKMRNKMRKLTEQYLSGINGLETQRFAPVLEKKNPFMLLPVVDLYMYREAKYGREFLSGDLLFAFRQEMGADAQLPAAIDLRGAETMDERAPTTTGGGGGTDPTVITAACQTMLHDAGILPETMAMAEFGRVDASAVWSRGNNYLVQCLGVCSCGSAAMGAKRFVISETRQYAEFVSAHRDLLQRKYEGGEVYDVSDPKRLYTQCYDDLGGQAGSQFMATLDFGAMFPNIYVFYQLDHSNMLPIAGSDDAESIRRGDELVARGRAVKQLIDETYSVYVYFIKPDRAEDTFMPVLMDRNVRARKLIKQAVKEMEAQVAANGDSSAKAALKRLKAREKAVKVVTNTGYGATGVKWDHPLANVALAASVTSYSRRVIACCRQFIETKLSIGEVGEYVELEDGTMWNAEVGACSGADETVSEEDERFRVIVGDTDGLTVAIRPSVYTREMDDDAGWDMKRVMTYHGFKKLAEQVCTHVANYLANTKDVDGLVRGTRVDPKICELDEAYQKWRESTGTQYVQDTLVMGIETIQRAAFFYHSKEKALYLGDGKFKHPGMPYSSNQHAPAVKEPLRRVVEHFLDENSLPAERNRSHPLHKGRAFGDCYEYFMLATVNIVMEACDRMKRDGRTVLDASNVERLAERYGMVQCYNSHVDIHPQEHYEQELNGWQQQVRQPARKKQRQATEDGRRHQTTLNVVARPANPAMAALESAMRCVQLPIKFPGEHVRYVFLRDASGEEGGKRTLCHEELLLLVKRDGGGAAGANLCIDAQEYLSRFKQVLMLLMQGLVQGRGTSLETRCKTILNKLDERHVFTTDARKKK
jgi:hypothetical protein